ncbi:hypothetical protein ACJIZ3_016574 [Penstemon smallii]|uniref:PROP1-like PPR domain-containing protein n=1 Tax=Penstemon smallii TaxID=265156 RepID=A0ABD3ST92_9LAMI
MNHYLRKLKKSPPFSNGGFFFSAAAELHSSNLRQNTASLRGRRGIQGKQANGSSLPMCILLNALNHSGIHSTHCQIPFVLSHPSSLSRFQKSLPLVRLIQNPNFSLMPKTWSLHNCRPFCEDVDSIGSESELESDGEKKSFNVVDNVNKEEVDRVCRVIDETFAFDRNMEAILDECGVNLSHDLVLAVLERFKHARKPAFRFFYWASDRPNFAHDSSTYNAIMSILGKTRQFETMVSVLEEMGEKGLLTIETFTTCIKAFASAKERKKAVGIFDLMKKYKYKVDLETINCLLDALGREKLGKEAQNLFEKLEHKFTPDLRTYTILLNGWCKIKNLMEAGRTWNTMIDNGFKPDIVAHNIMLEGLLKSQKRSDAVKLFEVMKSKGPFPNTRSYTILVRNLCKHGKMSEAFEYFNYMLKSECAPDAAMYTCLMIGFANQKKMEMVYSLMKEMKEKGCPPDGRTYNAMIKMMTNRHMPDDAVKVYKKMVQSKIQPTIHTFNMIMKSYFVAKNYEMGCEVWEEMKRKGCCPDENAYTVLIRGLIRQGRSIEACKYLEEMMDKGMRAPQLDYKKFSGKVEVANALARWMR